MMSSPTRPPASMTDLALTPNSVPAATAARSMSPVEMWGTTKCWARRMAWVPLPAPCRPSMTRRTPSVMALLGRALGLGLGVQEPLVVAHHQLPVDLLHGLDGHAHGNE